MTKRRVEPPRATPQGAHLPDRRIPVLALLGVLLVTFVVYLPSLGNGFTNWDDPTVVTGNPLVIHPQLARVLTTPVAGNYHPLTILSLALNHRLTGLRPASYHWLNLLLHLANTGLVFAFVWKLSRRRFWTTVATSLFFGIHPMHVESVAWVTERKDVLYAFFYLLGLFAYLRYLERRGAAWYVACLAAFILSLASKPAAVVFPLTLLALDWFFQRGDHLRLVVEKVPLLALSVAAGWLNVTVQQAAGAVVPAGTWSPFERLLFASYGSVQYVIKLFVPVHLSAIYPFPRDSSSIGPEFYGALAAMLVAFPTMLFLSRRLRPVLFGWAFFFVNIVLVLQFFPVGQAILADRYTYVPYIGLFLALTWWLDEQPRPGGAAGSARLWIAAVLVAMLPLSLHQTWVRCGVWRSSETLWTDAIRRFPHRLDVAHNDLGLALAAEGRLDEAISQYQEAIRIRGSYSDAHNNLGAALAAQGRLEEAVVEYRERLRLKSDDVEARNNLGNALAAQGQFAEAVPLYREALRLDPDNDRAHYNLGAALIGQDQLEEAATHFREAIRLDPGFAEACNNLGVVLIRMGRYGEAIPPLRRALELDPTNALAQGNLALALQKSGGRAAAGAQGASGRLEAASGTPAPGQR
jgi:protein O-mannosyl-transferase